MMNEHILVAMSGGVDSSAVSYILKDSGYDIEGVTMRLIPKCDNKDIDDARLVAEKIGFKHTVLDMTEFFNDTVVRPFAECYMRGGTPNPCVLCNQTVKFGLLMDYMSAHGFTALATGHYARVELCGKTGRYLLKTAADESKDQSYFLWTLKQEQLSHILFPLGAMTKQQARQVAELAGLSNWDKSDSQDICFIKDMDYADFIEERFGYTSSPGDFIDSIGSVLGEHRGHIRYTAGQRRGLGVPAETRLYVTGKDTQKNTVTLGSESDLYSKNIIVNSVNLIALEALTEPIRAEVRVRYSRNGTPATVIPLDGDRAKIEFDTPVRAAASGQSAVFYDGDTVIGGGIIS